MEPLKSAEQIRIKLRGRALWITPEACHLTALTDAAGTPLSLIPPERITAARACPTAALQLQEERAARSLRIYQAALALAHQIDQQITAIEDAA